MSPAAFDGDNLVLDPPPGVSNEEVEVLSVFRGVNEAGVPVVVSCWKVSEEELNEIIRTRRVWMVSQGNTVFPFYLDGFKPGFLPNPG